MRNPYYDQTAQRVQRVLAIPLADGGRIVNGVRVSPGDAARTDGTRARDAAFDQQTQGQQIQTGPQIQTGQIGMPAVPGSQVMAPAAGMPAPVGPLDPTLSPLAPRPSPTLPGNIPGLPTDVTGYRGSRYDPNFNANNGIKPADPARDFVAQQLLAMNGTVEGRNYTPEAIAKASTAQIQGELTAAPKRNDFINDMVTRGGTKTAAAAGFKTYDEAIASAGGADVEAKQDPKTGRWIVDKAAPAKAPVGFATREEAVASLPAGSKAQIQQNSTTGRFVIQQQVGGDDKDGPASGLAKLQADLQRAVKEGRTEDAEALRTAIDNENNPTDRPMSFMDWQFSKNQATKDEDAETLKYLGGNYGAYRRGFTSQTAKAKASTGNAKTITTEAEYAALPEGARFIYNGRQGIK